MSSASPIFVATFADGEVTRMTTNTALDKLDVIRGVRPARAAYESRIKKTSSRIITAHFESTDGAILAEHTEDQMESAP